MQVMAELVPRVGVGVLVCKGNHVLVGKRRSSVGGGKYALPGGFLDFGESWEECAAREVKEETGLAIRNVKFAHATNTVRRDERRPSHSVTIFVRSELTDPDAEPENLEPDKCEGWEWVEWPNVPQPVFRPLQSLIASNYKLSVDKKTKGIKSSFWVLPYFLSAPLYFSTMVGCLSTWR